MTNPLMEPVQHEIKIDLPGLIRLLAKNLYAEADVFVRELIQNGHDSIKRRSLLEQHSPPGLIRIHTNERARTISFTDNGAGLTEQEIHNYLATIGRSGNEEFRQELEQKGRHADVNLIGQFGIGLLSAFVVAYRVEVNTLSCHPDSQAWYWISEGQSHYTLQHSTRQEIGTTVTLYIAENYYDMLNPNELRKAIKKYADFIPYQIFLNDETAPTNAVNAPWHLTFASENERLHEYFAFADRRFTDYILEIIPVELKAPYQVNGVLFISHRHVPDVDTTGMLDIYQSRMFVTNNNRDMLPPWAKFVRGLIDSPALNLTASRDAIQLDTIAREIKDALGTVVIEHLIQMAKDNLSRFEDLMEWHSYHIKGMAAAYDNFFDAIADLVPFETNRGRMNLQRYSEGSLRLNDSAQRDIFYFSESGGATQFYMLCDAKGLLVINASNIFEERFLEKYAKRHPEVCLHQISGTGSEFLFERLPLEESNRFSDLVLDFHHSLPDPAIQVQAVRFNPMTLPAVAILSADAKLRQELKQVKGNVVLPSTVRELVGRLLEEHHITVPVTLYLNANNPTVQQLSSMATKRTTDRAIYQSALLALYNNAILLTQQLMTPDNAQAIYSSSNETIKLMIDQAEQLSILRTQLSITELKLQEKEQEQIGALGEQINHMDHIICMVALPFRDNDTFSYETVLLPALRRVLELGPYYWQVVRADELYFEETIEKNVRAWMQRAQAYIADISDLNPNVLMELGYMRWSRREDKEMQPVVVLERSNASSHKIVDLAGVIRITYPLPSADNRYAIKEISEALKFEFAKVERIQTLNRSKSAHYLSSLLIQERMHIDQGLAKKLSETFRTIENVIHVGAEEIHRKIPELPRSLIGALKEEVNLLFRDLGTDGLI